MPVLDSDFKGSTWFPNGHLETMLPALFRIVGETYQRKRVHLHDGDFMDLDFVQQGNNRLLILLHGLEGSSMSTYIKGFSAYFSQRGFDICAINFRSCSGEMNLLPRSYHSGATDDLGEVIQFILSNAAYTEVALTGFSLGGNVLLKYAGEQGEAMDPRIKVCVAFSVPVDLSGCAVKMSAWYNRIYLNRFLKSLHKKMEQKAIQFGRIAGHDKIPTMHSFFEFDDTFTAPLHGFEGAAHYYASCSALGYIDAIRTPTLLVNAHNDPFLPATCYPAEQAKNHPAFYFESPSGGGHVGFSVGLPNSLYWSEERAFLFIRSKMFQ